MAFQRKKKRLGSFVFWLLLVSMLPLMGESSLSVRQVQARTVEEVIREIEEKEAEKAEKEAELEELEGEGAELSKRSGSLADQVAQVQAEIDAKQAEFDQMQEDIVLLEDYLVGERERLGESASQLYQMSRLSGVEVFFESGSASNYAFRNALRSQVVDRSKSEIDRLISEVEMVQRYKTTVEEEKVALDTEKTALDEELAQAKAALASSRRQASSVRGSISGIQSDIEMLSDEQQKLLAEVHSEMHGEKELIPLLSGDHYFTGRGRYMKDGHGIGMSQYGAYGMGASGRTYQQIVTHYYTGVSLGSASRGEIPVVGYAGNMNLETYVAGLGEVADKACGTQAQVDENPAKYALDSDPNSVWDCWPEEAIKAQVVAARTYGLYYTRPPNNKSICTSATCQVYKGGTAKQWAADETSGVVIKYGGEEIGAFYHASARGHTENNEVVWASDGGNGYPKPYLKGVDDSQWAYRNYYYDWRWSTNGFSNEEFREMTNGVISTLKSYYWKDWIYDYYHSLPDDLGEIQSIELTRGASNRVRHIVFHGTNGDARINSFDFYLCYNKWIGSSGNSSRYGWLYGLEFSVLQVD